MRTISAHGLPHVQNTWDRPNTEVPDDGGPGWHVEDGDGPTATLVQTFDTADGVFEVRIEYRQGEVQNLAGLLHRVSKAVRGPAGREPVTR